MDIFNWPFPAPTPRLLDFLERGDRSEVVDASLLPQVLPPVNETISNETTLNETDGEG